MNVFQLFFANPGKLTTKQQSAQRALHAFIITVLGSAIAESYVLISQTTATSLFVGTILILSTMLATAGHAIIPYLQEQGVRPSTITQIEQDIEILSKMVNDIAVTSEKKDVEQ